MRYSVGGGIFHTYNICYYYHVRKHPNLDALAVQLAGSAEFAVVALPERAGTRTFHHFTKESHGLVGENGSALVLQPFPDSGTYGGTHEATSESHYVSIAEKAVRKMQEGELNKVVLARTKVVDGVARTSLVPWFLRLLDAYPKALVFVIATETGDLWIGATPELLVDKVGTTYRTLALAATHAAPGEQWTIKEYDEHDYVVRYLLDELKQHGISNVCMDGPNETSFGRLAHLRTDISFSSARSLTELVGLLHPTPALCGYPKLQALAFIREHEAQPRELYTGSMLIEHPNGDGVAYAFLRCGKLSQGGKLTLYAGCGMVAASLPLQELAESEAKIDSVLRLL
jgi:isochorismate synthase